MSPIREFICTGCAHQYEDIIPSYVPVEDIHSECPHCESKAELLPPLTGGYKTIRNNGSSVRPKGAGSRPKGAK